MKTILLLDPRGALANLDKPTIDRQKNYINSLKNLNSNNISLLILTSSKSKLNRIDEENLRIDNISKKTWDPFKFAILARKYLFQNDMNPLLILAGDPWISFFSGYILMKILRQDIPIQVQIHADVSDQNWVKINLKNKIKSRIIGFSVSKSASVRVVSPEIGNWLSNKYPNTKSKIVVSPIPLNISETNTPKLIPNSLGFVGRMEKDRGIDLLPQVATLIHKFDPNTRLILIGEGRLLTKISSEIKNKLPNMDVKNYGYLNGSDFENKLSEIGVLLSFAPSESYGRTVRECLLRGIPVFAVNSKSMSYLEKQYPNCGLTTFELEELCNGKIVVKLAELRDIGVKENLKRHILCLNENSSQILAQSWSNLIEHVDK
jgi:glycosyltransferase involved in cell wall biosynthesis